jgi:hypothetical protein
MESVSVRWRPSGGKSKTGGRGEFEYVPAASLEDREIDVFFEALDLTIPAEVRGVNVKSQGKPRLRKFEGNNKKKLHLPQLVMAVARLPEPRREDHHLPLVFPLENKSFVMEAMDFDVIDDDGITVTLAPLRVSIRHTDFKVNLQDRFDAIAADIAAASNVANNHPKIAAAITDHAAKIMAGVNSIEIRKAADAYIAVQAEHFGMTNAGSATGLIHFESLPETDLEHEITGKEGRILTRVHAYRERDRKFAATAKKYYKTKNGGQLWCVACDLKPESLYDDRGERCIEAHHLIPIEELQPDSIVHVDEMAMVCASCHRVIHSRKPCLTIDEVRALRPQAA